MRINLSVSVCAMMQGFLFFSFIEKKSLQFLNFHPGLIFELAIIIIFFFLNKIIFFECLADESPGASLVE